MRFILKLIANLYVLIGLVLLVSPFVYLSSKEPDEPGDVQAEETPDKETEIIVQGITEEDLVFTDSVEEAPPAAENTEQLIKIPSIGLDTRIYEGNSSVLQEGIWRMPIHGVPSDANKSTILAGHRWGPTNLSNEYRAKNLFYKLPQVRPGNEITVTWNNIDYKYKVIKIEESRYATQLSDLVLITCKYYNSPVRVFVYAKKI